ncbi:MAG: hypothetical protein KQI35_03760 [Bacteroidetes bacterium]|nr:hypothetical protein [Bacteroidota bacterium]
MATTRLRPRCRIVSKESSSDILNKLRQQIQENNDVLEGQVVQEHAFIRFPDSMQHYWSPELHVWAREEDGETIIYGVIGPKPKIWTMFMFIYTGILTSAFLGSAYGIIQFFLGMDAPFLWSIPLGILGMAFAYGAAQYGQYKAKDHMEALRMFLEETVGEEVPIVKS